MVILRPDAAGTIKCTLMGLCDTESPNAKSRIPDLSEIVAASQKTLEKSGFGVHHVVPCVSWKAVHGDDRASMFPPYSVE